MGVTGAVLTVTGKVRRVLVPQLLVAETEMLPPVLLAVIFIELVMELPAQPDGKVQLYVMPITLFTAYILVKPEQIISATLSLLMSEGCAGAASPVTDNERTVPAPQPLSGCT